MLELICLFFPALFSVFALERLLGKKLNLRNFLFVFVTNTMACNISAFALLFAMSKPTILFITSSTGINIKHSLFYLGASLFVAFLIILFERFYFYRLRIGFSDIKKEEAKKAEDDRGTTK